MLFPTLGFLLFFVAVAALLAPLDGRHRARKVVLLLASYFFYMQWDWRFGFLLFGSSLLTWVAGLMIERDRGRARWWVGLAVTAHMGVLCAFKYWDFLAGAANGSLLALGVEGAVPFLGFALPVGISFFTFHGISYVVDVYRGDVATCRRFEDMLLYLAFFPQLVAGPIVRAAYFLPQLYAPTRARIPPAAPLLLIVLGLFKKVVIATYLATQLVDPVFFDPANATGWDLVLAMYGYAIQIFCDFSGYSDMAIGLAGLLGFWFPPNFDQPYRAGSFQEFWRRWHISLSSWLRDYLYKPLGGSRHGAARTVVALGTTMLLGGLWHGAALKFLVWGAIHGAALGIERVVRPRLPSLGAAGRVVGWAITLHVVCVAWIFFRADSLGAATDYLGAILRWQPGVEQAGPFTVALILLGFAMQFTPPAWPQRLAAALAGTPRWALAGAAAVLVVLIDALGPDGVAPFIYFQF
jgi:alginate O-acetyltransferase complex protein AlgI